MASTGKVEIIVKGKDEASPALKDVGESAEAMAKKAEEAAKKLKEQEAATKKLAKSFTDTGKALMAVGTAVVGSLGAMVVSYAETGKSLEKLSTQTGIGVTSLSELKYAMDVTDASFSALPIAVKTMSSALVDSSKSITRLGLSLSDLRSMKPEQQFDAIVDALRGVQDKTEQVALATDIFGRSAQELLPYITADKNEIEALKTKAHELNLTFTDASAKAASTVADKMDTLKGAMTGVKNAIGAALLPVISNLVTNLTNGLKPILEWIGTHQGTIKMFLGIGAAILGAGGALFAIGKLIPMFVALKNAMTATSVAGIILQGITGVGLVKVAVGLAGAAVAIYAMNKMTESATGSLGDMGTAAIEASESITTLREVSTQTTDEMLDNFRALTDRIESGLEEQTSARKDALDEQLSVERDAHQERLDNLDEEEQANLEFLDAQTAFVTGSLNDQIDAIDDQLDAQSRAEKKARDEKTIADLQMRIMLAMDAAEKADLQIQLDEEIASQAADQRRQDLEDARQILRDKLEEARKAAEIQRQQQIEWWDEKKARENADFKDYADNIETQKDILDTALVADIKRYEDDIAAFEKALSTKLSDLEAYVKAAGALQSLLTSGAPSVPLTSEQSNAQNERQNIENQFQLGHISKTEYIALIAALRTKYPTMGFASGGTVPGKLGEPVPIIAHGGERFLGTQGQGSGGVIVNMTVHGSVVSERDLLQHIRDGLYKVQQRNYSTGLI